MIPRDEQDRVFAAYAEEFRRDALQKMADSAVVLSLAPKDWTNLDVKFALELGAGFMLDKPLVLVVPDRAAVPSRLARAADLIVEADPATPEGREVVAAALKDFVADGGSA